MVSRTVIVGLLFSLAMIMPFSHAQFGLPKKPDNKASAEAQVNADGEINGGAGSAVSRPLLQLLSKAEKQAGGTLKISPDDALSIDGLLKQALEDPQTQILVQEMKTMQREVLEQMLGETTPLDIVTTLKSVMDELVSLEILFKDPKRALKEMEKEGMIEKERLPEYKKNPDLLEQDTRKALYMTFVSTAVVGELM
eukprot:CAMPEP_0194216312 /NCGR_PEP_ID=MMETSP0156-20130528/18754_1 /TAXON_ID=33649 /ORGANISM="Thalassionema nitzschioides, Strain L26-B" /LENGTH=195 /DNA_ID=CAMNT_0038945057 /DNA_START=86 /DNA_END=673 /DNA_ORIENTATION=-